MGRYPIPSTIVLKFEDGSTAKIEPIMHERVHKKGFYSRVYIYDGWFEVRMSPNRLALTIIREVRPKDRFELYCYLASLPPQLKM